METLHSCLARAGRWRVNETWCVEFVRDGFWTFVGNVGVGVGVGLASVPVWVLVVCVNFEEVESV